MKKALILYYSQTGQTQAAIDAFATGFSKSVAYDVLRIEPSEKFAFPWKISSFFRAFPRCVKGLAPSIEPLDIDWKNYDLVILGYQVWFLSPSLPVQGFLNSKDAEGLRGKSVITIITCRNLWYSALGRIRARLNELGATHLGQITLCELSPVWASFVTTPRWMLTGKKAAFAFFPAAGISPVDFEPMEEKGLRLGRAWISGGSNASHTFSADWEQQFGSNLTKVSLAMMDWIGIRVFRAWAGFILKLAPRAGLKQDLLLVAFRLNLIALILTVAPCTKIFEVLVNNDPKWADRFSRVRA